MMTNPLGIPAMDGRCHELNGQSDRFLTHNASRINERQIITIFEENPEAMVVFNNDHQSAAVNPAACSLLGRGKEELIGQNLMDFVEGSCNLQRAWSTLWTAGRATGEVQIIRPDGKRRDVEYAATANFMPGLHLLVLHDITERKRSQEQLHYYAFYDSLTGLPNRAWFLNGLERSIRHAKREEDYVFAVLFLDLDRFAIVKYSFGHLVADHLLRATARRLGTCLKPTDILARIGTDEFAILLERIDDLTDAIKLADQIHKELSWPFQINGHEMFTTASIGIALGQIEKGQKTKRDDPNCSEHIQNSQSRTGLDRPEDFLRAADTAMYHAKTMGGGHSAVFDRAMHTGALAILQMETDLRRSLENQDFQLYYQPIVNLITGRIAGFEALVRWRHPERGLVSPEEFIPIAEGTGLIVQMGAWVLDEACRQLAAWQRLVKDQPSLFNDQSTLIMSVNLSGVQLSHHGLIQDIDQILYDSGLEGQHLKLEITETAIAPATDYAKQILLQIKKRRIQLCIDDFGTGYSSLSRLHRLPIDTLKIDRSFVSQMSMEEESWEIVRTIVSLAHNLKMDVIAEGVETPWQKTQLHELGCEYGQGYLFSRPLDAQSATTLIASMPQW